MSAKYTGRRIAIIGGCYGLLEPLEAIFNDIKYLGINEIYSLGNNIGYGPDSSSVIDLVEYTNTRSVVGEFERYCILGEISYDIGMRDDILRSRERVLTEIGSSRLDFVSEFPYSYDLDIGGRNVGLCCLANDIRISESLDTKVFLENASKPEFYQQFLMTNSIEERERIRELIERFGYNKSLASVYTSTYDCPIFAGKDISSYDTIIQGSIDIDRNLFGNSMGVDFWTLGSVISFYNDIGSNIASYTILHERRNNEGFDVERRKVLYYRSNMEEAIANAGKRYGKVKKLCLRRQKNI